jgi:hypothetical protein
MSYIRHPHLKKTRPRVFFAICHTRLFWRKLLGEIYVDSAKTRLFLFVSFHKNFSKYFFLDVIFTFIVFFKGLTIAIYFCGDHVELRLWWIFLHWYSSRNQ